MIKIVLFLMVSGYMTPISSLGSPPPAVAKSESVVVCEARAKAALALSGSKPVTSCKKEPCADECKCGTCKCETVDCFSCVRSKKSKDVAPAKAPTPTVVTVPKTQPKTLILKDGVYIQGADGTYYKQSEICPTGKCPSK